MAITFAGSTEGTFANWGDAVPATLSSVAVPALTNGLGIVFINMALGAAGGGPVAGVTWNGVSMTLAAEGVETTNSRFTQIWYLINPADDGNYDITMTSSGVGSFACSLHMAAAWASGVAQTTPLDDISEYDAQSASDPSITVTPSTTGQLCVASFVSSANTITTMATTEIQSHDFGGNVAGCSYSIEVSSGDTTFTFDLSDESQDWGGAGATFKEAAGGTDVNVATVTKALTLTEYAALLNVETSVLANVKALTLATSQAGVGLDTTVSTNLVSLALASYGASLNVETGVIANTAGLTLSTLAASIGADTSVLANAVALALATKNAGITLDINATTALAQLTLAAYAAGVNAETNVTATQHALTLTTYKAQLGTDTDVDVALLNLVLATYAAGINAEANITTTVKALTLAAQAAGIRLDSNVNAAVANLVLAVKAADVSVASGDVEVNAAVAQLLLATYAAGIDGAFVSAWLRDIIFTDLRFNDISWDDYDALS